jgi:hypothetical protein
VAGVVAVPIAGLTTISEMVTRSLLHLGLTRDLLLLHGVHLEIGDLDDLARLLELGVALQRLDTHSREDEAAHTEDRRELIERLLRTDWNETSSTIGSGLFGEGLLRNSFPFVGMLVSPLWSIKITRQLADTVLGYARHRRVLDEPYRHLEERAPNAVEVFLLGLWFVFTADGPLDRSEAATLARLLRRQAPPVRQRILGAIGEGVDGWLGRLADLDPNVRAPLLHALELAAAADARINDAERDVLHRAAGALRQPLDDGELDTMYTRLVTESVPSPA